MQSKSILCKNILAFILFGLMFKSVSQRAEAQYTFSLLHSFNHTDSSDGTNPLASVTLDSKGNLYGTTEAGGTYGNGTVFEIDTKGNFSLLHSFNAADISDGSYPFASVALDSQGNLYGTTLNGGTYNAGTVFKIDTLGNFTLLHSFNVSEGYYPTASVTLDSQGNLYGTIPDGGPGGSDGSVYKIDSHGTFSLLHSFYISDGAVPKTSVTLDSQGNLYGTTEEGGAYGYGTVFKIDTLGNFSLLHSFNNSDGSVPYAAVTLDSHGNLYGTTYSGGAYVYYGTVFKIDTLGNFSLVHSFNGSDGRYPEASVTLDSQGNLYGTTLGGGAYSNGAVYKIDSLGNFSLLHSFNGSDGNNPWDSVTLDNKGNLFGTTAYGGASENGTVFELANNITAPAVRYTYHGFVHRPGSHTFVQQVTITNASGAALTGPFNLVISGLHSWVTLNNPTATTDFTNPGSAYFIIGKSSLAEGASITVTLSFNDPSLKYISYTPTFIAGNGVP